MCMNTSLRLSETDNPFAYLVHVFIHTYVCKAEWSSCKKHVRHILLAALRYESDFCHYTLPSRS
jgi:hypothetical protein